MSHFLRKIYLSLIYTILYLPIVVVVIFSFNASPHSLIWHGLTWHWYRVLWQDGDLAVVAWHSFELGICAASVGTFLGLMAAMSLFRYRFFGQSFLQLIIFCLIILPDLVLAIGLLLLLSFSHFPLGFWSLLIAHATFCLPFAAITMIGALRLLDSHIIEASLDLGASEWNLYTKIILPLILPSLLASWLLSLTLSIDDVVISYFVSGPDFEILPLKIYSLVKLGVSPEINALCTILLGLTLLIVMASQWLLRRNMT